MWSRQLFFFGILAITILTSQSHDIEKRGLLSKLFGKGSKSQHDVERDMPVRERSKFRELLKNPVVIAMLSAAVGMIIQKALAARNMNDVCENKYVQMAQTAGNLNPELKQVINLLGCNSRSQKYDSSKNSGDIDKSKSSNRYTTTPATDFSEDENSDNQEKVDEEDKVESAFPPERESKLQQIMSIVHGEKGAKRKFLKNLLGFNKSPKKFKQGQKLPSSSYKMDKDDVDSLKELENELEQYNKQIH